MPIQKIGRASKGINGIFALEEAMTLALVDNHLCRTADFLDRIGHLLRLRSRAANIVRSCQQEQWGAVKNHCVRSATGILLPEC